MKRFTASEKWAKEWHRQLSPKLKCFWDYLTTNCDAAGLWEPAFPLASFQIGEPVSAEDLGAFGDRIEVQPDGRWWLTGFIEFQYGELNENCRPHQAILRKLEKRSLLERVSIGYTKGIQRGQEKEQVQVQVQEKDQDQKGECEGEETIYPPEARVAIAYLNEKTNSQFWESSANLGLVHARLKEPGVTIDGIRQMIDRQCQKWRGTKMADYMRPATLFNKTKFEAYYAERAQPIYENDTRNHKPTPSEVRNAGIQGAERSAEKVRTVLARREAERLVREAEKAQAAPNAVATEVAGP